MSAWTWLAVVAATHGDLRLLTLISLVLGLVIATLIVFVESARREVERASVPVNRSIAEKENQHE